MAMQWGRTDCTGLTDWRSLGLFFLDREAAKSSVRRSSWRRHWRPRWGGAVLGEGELGSSSPTNGLNDDDGACFEILCDSY